jgi:septal ring factor EnvC (AmiA/AmiB activator)
MFANIVSAFKQGGIPGIIAGIALATAVVAGLCAFIGVAALGISAAVSSGSKSDAEKSAEKINKLSNEIYKLNEAANGIKNITSQFDALDDKIIKTTEDLKEMSSLLDSAGDKLSAENEKD